MIDRIIADEIAPFTDETVEKIREIAPCPDPRLKAGRVQTAESDHILSLKP